MQFLVVVTAVFLQKVMIRVYHNFPKENVTNTTRKEWIRRCKRADNWNPNTSQICSIHFTEHDYEPDMRNHVLGNK